MPHNLFLTGRPGVGKTTVIQRVLRQLPPLRLSGFTTAEIRGPRGRLGFHATALGGRQIVLAHVDLPSRYRVSRYGVDVAAFEQEIVPLLDSGRGDVDLFIVDEIGKMECFSAAFCTSVRRLLQDERPLLGTIALRGPAFIQEVRGRPDLDLLEVTPINREALPGEIATRLGHWLGR